MWELKDTEDVLRLLVYLLNHVFHRIVQNKAFEKKNPSFPAERPITVYPEGQLPLASLWVWLDNSKSPEARWNVAGIPI